MTKTNKPRQEERKKLKNQNKRQERRRCENTLLMDKVKTNEDLLKLLFDKQDTITLNTKDLHQRRNDSDLVYSVNLIWQFIRLNPRYIEAYKQQKIIINKLKNCKNDQSDEKDKSDSNFGRAWYLHDHISPTKLTIHPSLMLLERPVIHDRMMNTNKLDNRVEFQKYAISSTTPIETIQGQPLIIHINPLFSEKVIIDNIKDVIDKRRKKHELEKIDTISGSNTRSLIRHLTIRHILTTYNIPEEEETKIFNKYISIIDTDKITRFGKDQVKNTTRYFKDHSSKMPWALLGYK